MAHSVWADCRIQQFGGPNEVLIRIEEQPGGDKAQQEAVGKVQAALGDKIELRRVEVVGATVSAELITSAITALALALLGIFAYLWFRFEWQFSVSAIVALLHDMAMVLCLFSILQLEVDLTIVAALLTLIGYAVNDTVVTFDRVRENLRKYKRMPLNELIDLSVNETLSRTAMTAGAVLITLVALFVFAGPVIRGFTLAMLFGGAVSSYTSMFVAAPLLYVIGVKRDWGTDAAPRPKGLSAASGLMFFGGRSSPATAARVRWASKGWCAGSMIAVTTLVAARVGGQKAYRPVEEGVAEIDDTLKDRIAAPRAPREGAIGRSSRAKIRRNHAAYPRLIEQFGRMMRENLMIAEIPFRTPYGRHRSPNRGRRSENPGPWAERRSGTVCYGTTRPHRRGSHICSRLAPRVGFEPTTSRLTAGCSTAELPRNTS